MRKEIDAALETNQRRRLQSRSSHHGERATEQINTSMPQAGQFVIMTPALVTHGALNGNMLDTLKPTNVMVWLQVCSHTIDVTMDCS
jgi:hypothetical protein